MILDNLANALKTVDENVFYGTASKLRKGAPWDCIVYRRSKAAPGANLNALTESYDVCVIREGYVECETADAVIDAVKQIPGMKLDAGSQIRATYDVKPNTNDTVEMLTITFTRARKLKAH